MNPPLYFKTTLKIGKSKSIGQSLLNTCFVFLRQVLCQMVNLITYVGCRTPRIIHSAWTFSF